MFTSSFHSGFSRAFSLAQDARVTPFLSLQFVVRPAA